MKHLLQFLLLIAAFTLVSCSVDKSQKLDYRVGKDGLIYESGSERLYTGRIVDTAEVIIEMEVVDGKKHGEFVTYYKNGNVEKQGYINENINEGEWKYYYEDGKLESTGSFKNDKAQGEWVFYHKNGNKKEEGKFLNGQRDGLWTLYDENGKLKNKLNFQNGNLLDSLNDSI